MDQSSWTLQAFVDNPFSRLTTFQLCQRLVKTTASGSHLHEAARRGVTDTVRELVKSHADLDEIDADGRTALHLALRSGSPDIVAILLEAGASPNPPSLPPPSTADVCFILFRMIKFSFKGLVLAWIASKLGIPVLSTIFRNVKSLAICELVAMALLYILSSVVLLRSFPHFRPDSVTGAATTFKGDFDHMILLLLNSGFQPRYDEMMALWKDAVYKGYSRVCQRLICMGWDVDVAFIHVDPYEERYPVLTALLYACGASHRDLALLLISNGADPAQVDKRGWSCLLLASKRWYHSKMQSVDDSDAIIEALLSTEAIQFVNKTHFPVDLERRSSFASLKWGWPLAEACGDIRPRAVQLLLDAGADPNLRDEFGVTALHIASGVSYQNEGVSILEMLLSHGADVNAVTRDSWTAVGRVANAGVSPEALAVLLHAGAQVKSGAGEDTPLQIAARHDVSEGRIVQLLLENGAPVNATGGQFGSPLLAALNKPNDRDTEPQILKLLSHFIAHGVDLNMVPDGYTPPIVKASTQDWPFLVSCFLEMGAVIPAQKEVDLAEGGRGFERNVLHVSLLSHLEPSQEEVFEILLKHGALPNGDTIDFSGLGMTVLGYACSSSRPEYVRTATLLLEHGADPNRSDPQGSLPLHCAAYAISLDHVRKLFEYGATPDVRHDRYGTPWHSLCKGFCRQQTWARDPDVFNQIVQLFERRLDNAAIWTHDGRGRNCLHYLAELSEETHLIVSTDGQVSQSRSPAIGVMERFLKRHGRLHPTVLLDEDSLGQTVFHIAAKNGDVDMMTLFLERIKSGVEAESSDDESLLVEFIAALIGHRDNHGWNAVHHAASQGRALACKFFTEPISGGIALPLTTSGESAQELAKKNGHHEIAQYLSTFSGAMADGEKARKERNEAMASALGITMHIGFSDTMLMEAVRQERERMGLGD
jgi:ankyrin repeat protein